MRIVVVGAGVAGSAVALAAARVGHEVILLERRPSLDAKAGSWITLAPNGLDALDVLGVSDDWSEGGAPTRANRMFDARDRLLGEVTIGTPLVDGRVGLTVRRSALSTCLARQAAAVGAELRLGAVVEAVELDGPRPAAIVAGERIEADLLIGADGVWSRVRRAIDPAAPVPRYTGLLNFGGIVDAPELARSLEPAAWHFVFGTRAFVGAHPLPTGEIVWFVNLPGDLVPTQERSTTTDDVWRERLLEAVRGDQGFAAELIRRGRFELVADSTHDLPTVPIWSRAGAVLIGDAVHAPSPSSGQGASLALEDAVELVRALGSASNPDERDSALAAFEATRRPRVERVVRNGARSGSSKLPTGFGRVLMDGMLTLLFRSGFAAREVLATTAHRL